MNLGYFDQLHLEWLEEEVFGASFHLCVSLISSFLLNGFKGLAYAFQLLILAPLEP